MKRFLLLSLLSLCCAYPAFSLDSDICRSEGYSGRILRVCNQLCVHQECGNKTDYYTTGRCVWLTNRFIRLSDGEMPPCIPRYADGYYPNELYCYSNWRVKVLEQCDPLYDPDVDQYNVIDETDGTTEYEMCLMNSQAQFDVCMFHLQMYAGNECYDQYTQPCYEEYEITGDNDALQACIDSVQWEIDACRDEIKNNFYFNYLYE